MNNTATIGVTRDMEAFGPMEEVSMTFDGTSHRFVKELEDNIDPWTTVSSADSAVDSSCMITALDPVEEISLWKEEIQKKCVKLARNLEDKLRCLEHNKGLSLKFSYDLPKRISAKIADVASSEPCGLRGCCVHLRLLHEDLANALVKTADENNDAYNTRAQKSASWHDMPQYHCRKDSVGTPCLNFCTLPSMDAALTGRLTFDKSSKSQEHFPRRRLRKSLSSPAELPSLSGASKLRVPCVDLGCLDLCDQFTVPTFEIYVYLVPTVTWMWRVKKLFSTSIKPDSQICSKSTISIEPDFTLVKKRLYRTRNNTFEVHRYPVTS